MSSEAGPEGIGLEDLPWIYREQYLYAIELVRVRHDPATDWEGFRETLWASLIRVFGLEVDERWPEDLPDPRGQVSGDAREVAAWMRQRLDESGQGSSPRASEEE